MNKERSSQKTTPYHLAAFPGFLNVLKGFDLGEGYHRFLKIISPQTRLNLLRLPLPIRNEKQMIMLLQALEDTTLKEIPYRLILFSIPLEKEDLLSDEKYEKLIERFKREFEEEYRSYGLYI